MRLVMCYTEGDGCTYSCDTVLPIEYASPEQALVDFEKLCLEAKAASEQWVYQPGVANPADFTFAGRPFFFGTFFSFGLDRFYLPEFLTIDEWFAKECVTLS